MKCQCAIDSIDLLCRYTQPAADFMFNPFSAGLPYILITLRQAAWKQHTHTLACLAHTADKLSRITNTSISQ